ncbi:MAG: ABC transporter permease subunit [Haloarculaceae archaeon]
MAPFRNRSEPETAERSDGRTSGRETTGLRGAAGSPLPSPTVLAAVLGAVLLGYYLLPLAGLLATQSPSAILARLAEPAVRRAAITSLLGATVTTLLALVFGLPLAYWLSRTTSRLRTPVVAVVVLPLVLPPVVSGMLLFPVVGTGPVAATAGHFGIATTRSVVGVVLAQTFVASPYLVITALAAFERVDPHYEEVAETLGLSRYATVRKVTIPLARNGIVAGATLTFARAMGEFGATMLLAYRPRTLPVSIFTSFLGQGTDAAFPIAVVLLVVSLVALAVLQLLGTDAWPRS